MRQNLAREAAVFVAILFVVGLLSPRAVVSSKAFVPEPDITITFRGLMVFDQLSNGVQVVRLHSDADHHKLNIRVFGPGFPDGVDWARDLPKGATLQFNLVANPPLPPSASWVSSTPTSPAPFDIKRLHPNSGSLGDFIRKPTPDDFAPIFTLNAGAFIGKGPLLVDFVSLLDPQGIRNESVPTFVEATIAEVVPGQMGNLSGDGLDSFPLTKPGADTKWRVIVSNEPDYNHVCGYHFTQYYKGFKYTRGGPVVDGAQYGVRPNRPTTGPCDRPHSQPQALNEIVQGTDVKASKTAIETRPCIPISY